MPVELNSLAPLPQPEEIDDFHNLVDEISTNDVTRFLEHYIFPLLLQLSKQHFDKISESIL